MVFQHFLAPDPAPHRPPNRPIFQLPGQKEKKQKKELAYANDATSIGLRPLSVNRALSQRNGQKEKKQKKELAYANDATAIGLRPLSVNRCQSVRLPPPDHAPEP